VSVRDKFVSFVRGLGQKGEVNDALSALRKYVATASAPRDERTTKAP
jgi:hypothetical protein